MTCIQNQLSRLSVAGGKEVEGVVGLWYHVCNISLSAYLPVNFSHDGSDPEPSNPLQKKKRKRKRKTSTEDKFDYLDAVQNVWSEVVRV